MRYFTGNFHPQDTPTMTRHLRIFVFVAWTCVHGSVAGQVHFAQSDFHMSLERAHSEGKPLLVYAYTSWCGECKIMENTTFTDSTVGTWVDSNFVAMRVNAEEGFGVDLVMKHRVTTFPQILIFNHDGQLMHRILGFHTPDALPGVLAEAQRSPALPRLARPLEFDLAYPDFLKRAYLPGNERHFPDRRTVEAYLDTRDSLTDEVSWAVISRFVTSGRYVDSTIAIAGRLAQLYGHGEVTEKLSSFVFADVKAAIKSDDRAAFVKALDDADRILGEDAEYYKLSYRLYYNQMTGDWEGFAEAGEEYLRKVPERASVETRYELALTLYRNSDRESALRTAERWMEGVVAEIPTYETLSAYAELLYKLGEDDKALEAAKEALKLSADDGQTDQTRALIEKIESP